MTQQQAVPGDYVIPEPAQADIEQLAMFLAMIDPERKGINMSQLRAFYPKLGWGHIQKRLEALQAAGRVKSAMRTGGAVPLQYWTWEEV